MRESEYCMEKSDDGLLVIMKRCDDESLLRRRKLLEVYFTWQIINTDMAGCRIQDLVITL